MKILYDRSKVKDTPISFILELTSKEVDLLKKINWPSAKKVVAKVVKGYETMKRNQNSR